MLLSPGERQFLSELHQRGVRYLLIGASAANAQGARIATVDMDLWFEDLSDPRIAEAAKAAGGVWVSGAFGIQPPQVGGLARADRFDVVTHAHGLDAFEQEFERAKSVEIDEITVKMLPLERIIASKRAAARPRDLAQLPALEEALAVLEEKSSEDR
jgi:predicted nucleotidyltransferase